MSLAPRRSDAAWIVPAHVGVLALAALVYVFNLTVSGFANTYYAMAAQAASLDWGAWFWGSLDPSNFITVDKPPLGTMLMGLSVRLFGLSSWSILLPEALCGVATVAVLYAIVRRTSGPVAATIAALVATLTPAAVLIFRYNNPDALLTLLLVLAAWAFIRALGDARMRWVILAALFVGLAFNTKFLQAYLVLPAFAVTYAIAAQGSPRHRLVGLLVALATVLISSGWWVLAVELVPAGVRPFIGGSSDGTGLQLLFGYDGLARILGFGAAPVGAGAGPGAGPGAGFSGTPGILRMFNNELGGQIAWLLPFALIGAVASLSLRLRRPRTDLSRAAVLMWTLWLLTHAVVFSLMSGIIHSYYTVVMAPAIGALVGTGAVDLWRARNEHRLLAGLSLVAAIAVSAALAWRILLRTPEFMPGLAEAVLVVGLGAAAAVAFIAVLPTRYLGSRAPAGRAAVVASALGMAVLLVGPAAYTANTMATAYSGGDPQAGPLTPVRGLIAAAPIPGRGADDGGGGFGPPPGQPGQPGQPGSGFGTPGQTGALIGGNPDLSRTALEYLVGNRGSSRWIVAANSSSEAAPIQLATGLPVMAMGGFNGSDVYPTLGQLKAYISSGELRFVLAAGRGLGGPGFGGSGFGQSSSISTWVQQSCSPVAIAGDSSNKLYDCAGAV
jgi:4-amino-4-deoxy-L-arabinose transferase-like glycosyltransferase